MATTLIVIPIAVSAARELEASPKPTLVAVAVAGAAVFLTHVATPANLMVMEPGGSRRSVARAGVLVVLRER